jgi:hypothetical protein
VSSDVRDSAAGQAADGFGRGEAVVQAYENAKLSYIRGITQEAEMRLREAFAKRREAINEEIGNLRTLARSRQEAANQTAQAYAKKLPHRVRKSGVRAPSFFERLRTFNKVSKLYRNAARASAELDEVNELLRKRRDRLEQMERETRRSIYLREESVRKKLQTPEGLAALHADPVVKAAFQKMQNAMNERAKYEERVKRGEVPPEEARDRDMATNNTPFAAVPLESVMIARIVRYGPLEYYVLRNLQQRESLLSGDPSLEPLRDVVFDVTRSSSGYEASLRHNEDGVPMRMLDHLKLCYSSSDASEHFKMHRAALRTDRVVAKTPPHDDAEAELVAMLAMLANAVASRGTPPPQDGAETE